jgi:valyl-tRNA synthetase
MREEQLSNRYSPNETESKWYAYWDKQEYFRSVPDEREPYTICLPPPNVTGVLHMGHMLNHTIQDILIRRARLQGKNACWVPGTDHASIATEAKVVALLREQGITKSQLGREKFLEKAFEWKEKYGSLILQQMQLLGASCDWSRTAFTMDQTRSKSVLKVFVDLYRKGKLYRDHRMINWDPEAKTVLSNEEVLYSEENNKLYHVKYPVAGHPEKFITIATTRPETILADTAIAVHPEDERYSSLHGLKVLVPVINREVSIICDEYVDREFGTGALKITPAHDPNDYEIGKKHGLEVIDIMHDNGTMNELAMHYNGMDRFAARKAFAKELEALNLLEKVEDYRHNVGRSERTSAIVEPRLSLQWYVKMESLAKPALDAVKNGEIKFYPDNMRNTYNHWMENVRDWCISRQLWWGHRIPAWYLQDEVFVAETAEEALELAKAHFNNPGLQITDLKQDEDVLDTWFSSWLWPISVFNGLEDDTELKYYYPTQLIVTGWDIIFLWIARMIMAGYEYTGKKPYDAVFFTGMVRDTLRRKMSKSLGNSPDTIALIRKYGADSVRFGVLSSAQAGGDLLFDTALEKDGTIHEPDSKLCEQGRNFCNKIWNATRLVNGWEASPELPAEDVLQARSLATDYIRNRLAQVQQAMDASFTEFRISEALVNLYTFIWNDFCSFYLEAIKPAADAPMDAETLQSVQDIFSEAMKLLHPFMPFITEEIWHQLKTRRAGDDIMVSCYPETRIVDKHLISAVELLREIGVKSRDLRNKYKMSQKELLPLFLNNTAVCRQLLARKGVSELLKTPAVLKI